MSIKGIGTDIVRISRIDRLLREYPHSFAERILHQNELRLLKKHKSPKAFLAKRFSAKEAVAKALGTGIAKGVTFQDIEISNNEFGQPIVTLHGKTLEIAEEKGVKNYHVSLSDEKSYAIAYVVLD